MNMKRCSTATLLSKKCLTSCHSLLTPFRNNDATPRRASLFPAGVYGSAPRRFLGRGVCGQTAACPDRSGRHNLRSFNLRRRNVAMRLLTPKTPDPKNLPARSTDRRNRGKCRDAAPGLEYGCFAPILSSALLGKCCNATPDP